MSIILITKRITLVYYNRSISNDLCLSHKIQIDYKQLQNKNEKMGTLASSHSDENHNNWWLPTAPTMKFITSVLFLVLSTTTVDAHGAMNEPKGPEGIINIACPRPDGGNGNHDTEWKQKNNPKCWEDGESLHFDTHW